MRISGINDVLLSAGNEPTDLLQIPNYTTCGMNYLLSKEAQMHGKESEEPDAYFASSRTFR